MDEEITFPINDTFRTIERIITDLRKWDSPSCNQRVKALILTRLEEAQLWALRLINSEEPSLDPNR